MVKNNNNNIIMTAETLKPFLSLSGGASSDSETDVKEMKSRGKALLLCFVIGLLVIFSVTVLSLLIIYMVKVNLLQQKVDEIEQKLMETRKHLRFVEYDDLTDLDDFANSYNKNRVEDDDDEIYLDSNDKSLYGKEKKNITSDYDDDNTFLDDDFGSGDYVYDDEDDESLELYGDDDDEILTGPPNNGAVADIDKNNNIYEDIKKSQLKRNRERRALAGLTRQGVPIMEESYLERRNRTSNEHLEPLLNAHNAPKMKLDWNDSRYSSQIHHQRYQSHHQHHTHQQHRQHTQHNVHPVHHRPSVPVFRSENLPIRETMDDKIVLTDQFGAPRGYAQESVQAPIEYAPPPVRPIHAAAKSKSRQHSNGFSTHKLALHFIRDPRETSHHGHHVREGIIYNDWMLRQNGNKNIDHFIKMDLGVVKIKIEGLYYVYAQMAYDTSFGTDSFVIERNQNRQRRALAGLTRQGVPIMEESYLERRNRTSNEHLEPLLNAHNAPKMKLDWNDSRYSSQLHHQRYQSHHQHHTHQQHRQHTQHNVHPVHHRPAIPVFRSENLPIRETMDDKIVLTDQFGAPRGYAQESVQAPIEYAPPPVRPIHAASKSKSRQHSNGFSTHKLALHFIRDPRETSHHGHHVREGIIYNDWMLRQNRNKNIDHFIKMDLGVVKIKIEGLYYVYAQMAYDTSFGTDSFVIERNQSPELQCSVSSVPNPSTCFTAGILHLKQNDMIYVKDLNMHRSNVKDPHKAFFGMIKLA
uniref:CSON009112 protein n=1 Tax=Culicoides sonorensis TaxID=179676 RepID=A0A336M3G8_CULSO